MTLVILSLALNAHLFVSWKECLVDNVPSEEVLERQSSPRRMEVFQEENVKDIQVGHPLVLKDKLVEKTGPVEGRFLVKTQTKKIVHAFERRGIQFKKTTRMLRGYAGRTL